MFFFSKKKLNKYIDDELNKRIETVNKSKEQENDIITEIIKKDIHDRYNKTECENKLNEKISQVKRFFDCDVAYTYCGLEDHSRYHGVDALDLGNMYHSYDLIIKCKRVDLDNIKKILSR